MVALYLLALLALILGLSDNYHRTEPVLTLAWKRVSRGEGL